MPAGIYPGIDGVADDPVCLPGRAEGTRALIAPLCRSSEPSVSLTVVACLKLLIELKVPELRLRVRLALSNDLIVELALDLTVEDLQLLVSDVGQVLGKMFLRG